MTLLKRRFASSVRQSSDDSQKPWVGLDSYEDNSQNPWAGLASYEDPATARRHLKFCGRDDDSYDLSKLIMGNVFVTLYGKSGIGKTSLLNAGVFPELREEQYTPISIRLGMRDGSSLNSFQNLILETVRKSVHRITIINVIPDQEDQEAIDFLWKYFVGHEFYDKNENPTIPVVVFDQFEEILRKNRKEAETLLRQLNTCAVNGSSLRYDTRIRFVISIREDDLFLLEDSIDNCYIPALKRSRYRLRSLSDNDARDVILVPGKGLFKEDEQESIAKRIIEKSRNADGSINTNIVSLLCSRIYFDAHNSGYAIITPSLVDSFLKGNPFESFYDEATRSLSNREKSFIEDNLVDSTGRRNSIPESDFLINVPTGNKLLIGKSRILQLIDTGRESRRIELIHDSFCESLTKQKEKRKQRRKWLYTLALSVVTIAISAITIWVIRLYSLSQQQNVDLLIQQETLYVNKAAQLSENDPFSALLLLNELSDDTGQFANIPLQPNAEFQIRKALKSYNSNYWKPVDVLQSSSYIEFSPGGHYLSGIISGIGIFDCSIQLWDAYTREELMRFSGTWKQTRYCISNSDNAIAIPSDNTISIYSIETGDKIKEICVSPTDCFIKDILFTPDDKRIICTSNKTSNSNHISTVYVIDIESGRIDHSEHFEVVDAVVNCLEDIQISEDGSRCLIIADVRKKTNRYEYEFTSYECTTVIRVWDINDWNLIYEAPYNGELIARFFDNDSILIGTPKGIFNIDINTNRARQISSWGMSNKGGRDLDVLPDKKSIIACCGHNLVHINLDNGCISGENHPFEYDTNWYYDVSIRDSILITRLGQKNYLYKIPAINYLPIDTRSDIITTNREQFVALNNGFFASVGIGYSGEYNRDNRALRIADKNNNTCFYDDNSSFSNLRLQGDSNTLYAIAQDRTTQRLIAIKVDDTGHVEKELGLSNINTIYSIPSSSANSFFLLGQRGNLLGWDASTDEITNPGITNVYKADYSPSGNKFIVIDSTFVLKQYELRKKEGSNVFSQRRMIFEAKYTEDGKHILALSDERELLLIDSRTLDIVKSISLDRMCTEIEINKGWDYIVLSYAWGGYIIDKKSFAIKASLGGEIPRSAWSITNDGRYYVSYPLTVNTSQEILPHIDTIYTQREIINQARQIVGRKARKGEIDELLK